MDARRNLLKNHKGQSLVEFALILPVIIGMLAGLIQVQKAISTGIVNQKWSRATMQYLMFNHRQYIEHQFLKRASGSFFAKVWIGVSDKTAEGGPGNSIKAVAPLIRGVKASAANEDDTSGVGSSEEFDESSPTTRQDIRVRVLSFACIPPLGPNVKSFYAEGILRDETFLGSRRFRYCAD